MYKKNLLKKKLILSFLEKNFIKKRKAISPLIATILLIVVAVAIIAIVVSWGKGFATDSIAQTDKINIYSESDVSFYIYPDFSMNGRTVIEYKPPANSPFRDLNITGYEIIGLTTHVVPFDEPIILKPNHSVNIDHGVILPEIDLVLYLDNDTIITKKKLRQEIRQPSSCPQGFIPVPGNHLYGTMNRDGGFCVAKWEMKVDTNGDGIGNLNSDVATDCDYYGKAWYHYKGSHEDCNVGNPNYTIVSSAYGHPINYISQSHSTQFDSKQACESIGGHLITNNEWMTIARNIELVPENWTGGEIGSGGIYRGNVGTCDILSEACYDGDNPESGLEESRNTKARLKLTNNEYIWDFSGNLWEWTDDIIDTGSDSPYRFLDNGDPVTDATDRYYDYSPNGGTGYYISYSDLGNLSLDYKDLFLFTSGTYNANQGVGRIYLRSGSQSDRAFLRGGYWNNGTIAGVLALRLYYSPGSTSSGIGLRCVQ